MGLVPRRGETYRRETMRRINISRSLLLLLSLRALCEIVCEQRAHVQLGYTPARVQQLRVRVKVSGERAEKLAHDPWPLAKGYSRDILAREYPPSPL